jgi:hypothetical protein
MGAHENNSLLTLETDDNTAALRRSEYWLEILLHTSTRSSKYELGNKQTMRFILLLVLILLLIAALPSWPYSAGWGYYPSGGLGLIVLIVLLIILLR